MTFRPSEPVLVLAMDLGASGGRVILGRWDPVSGRISLREVCHFENVPVAVGRTLVWDLPRLLDDLGRGVRQAVRNLADGESISGLAFDTWGVDFGLVDAAGDLVGFPIHYRDRRTEGQVAAVNEITGAGTLFQHTGVQDAWFNTVYQLRSLVRAKPFLVPVVQNLLFIPDLLNFLLTGITACERTIASTSQLLGPDGRWGEELFRSLELPRRWMLPIREPGQILGPITQTIAQDWLLRPGTPVSLIPSHDTEAALVAVPADPHRSFAVISCGTWAVLGTELGSPILTDQARLEGFSNEAGMAGTFCLLKNIMGMWPLQECKRWWDRDGQGFTYEDLVESAEREPAWQSLIDVTDEVFAPPGDMPRRVRDFCRQRANPVPDSPGALVRCLLESLACEFRHSLEALEGISGKRFDDLWLVGGGTKNRLLCQLTADVTGREVHTGPAETTALGNVVSQFFALGVFSSVAEGRAAVAQSFDSGLYRPQAVEAASIGYSRWRRETLQSR